MLNGFIITDTIALCEGLDLIYYVGLFCATVANGVTVCP